MEQLNIFKVSYEWYEGDYGSTLLCKAVSEIEFEADLAEAIRFTESLLGIEIMDSNYLGKGYSVQCLPEYYYQLIWFLTEKKGYQECDRDENIEYFVNDESNPDSIYIRKRTKKNIWKDLYMSGIPLLY